MKRLLPLCLILLLGACQPQQPLKIGYIGNITGRFADLDSSGRDGALLAIEMRNQAGGVKGRPVELLVRDGEANDEKIQAGIRDLSAKGVAVVVGPMTSIVATAAAPAANAEKLVIIAGTATTTTLTGKDDYFFRIIADASVAARSAAARHRQEGYGRVAVVIDVANRDYAESWATAYQKAFVEAGGQVSELLRFDSRQPRNYQQLAATVLKGQPDIVSISSEASDAALLAQQLRRAIPNIGLAGSNWAATERLLEVGGKSVENMICEQSYRRDDPSERYQKFLAAYHARFGHSPNIGRIAGFDAANVAMTALATNPAREQMKATLLALRKFDGLQDEIRFDDFGDANRRMYLAQIINGRLVSLQP